MTPSFAWTDAGSSIARVRGQMAETLARAEQAQPLKGRIDALPRTASSPDREVEVEVDATRREISGIHLEVLVVDGELYARDLDSTNGTLVLTSTRPPRLLHEGRSTALRPGDILDLGDDYRISVGTRNQPA